MAQVKVEKSKENQPQPAVDNRARKLVKLGREPDKAGSLTRAEAFDDKAAQDFVSDADASVIYQDPLRARKAIWLCAVMVALLLLWSAVAEVDEITKGDGKVIPSSRLQLVQSLDGGIVSEILVKEGDVVQEGQVLLKIDETRMASTYKESRSTYLSLTAKAARLRAITQGTGFAPPPEVVAEAPMLVEQERALYLKRKEELDTQVMIAQHQLAQRHQELNEIQARRNQASQSYELTAKELALTRPLVQSGAVSDVDLLRLERDVARFRGEQEQGTAQIARLQSAISEAKRKIEEVELEFKNQARSELSDTQAKISAIAEGSIALSDKVKQATIKAPLKGTVQRLLVNTVGGVVQPGKDIVEIVPLDAALVLEARVQPKDIAFLRPEQRAMVKFTAYDFAIYGGLVATLVNISPDSVIDEKGNAFYVVRVRTDKPNLGPNLPIIPGMIAEVDILTGKKTILRYLMKPVLRAKQYALTER